MTNGPINGPIAGVILAAGQSRRFAGDKRRALLRGKPLLHHVIDTLSPLVDELVVVVRPAEAELHADLVPQDFSGRLVTPECGASGMGDSLAAGISACAHCQAALVMLADLPAVQQTTVQAVISALSHSELVQPESNAQAGHPVAFHRHYFSQLMQLSGDCGARRILATNPLCRLTVSDDGIWQDIDTQQQLAKVSG